MSNTATVTPYAGSGEDIAAGLAAAAAVTVGAAALATAAVVGYLCDTSEVERAALNRDRARRDRSLLDAGENTSRFAAGSPTALMGTGAAAGLFTAPASGARSGPALASLPLRITDPVPLIAAAGRLGYRPAPSSTGSVWLMTNDRGERLALSQGASGSLALHAPAGSRATADAVMRQYTFDQVTAHFKSKNMNVEVTQRGRGEVEIQAREIATTGAPDDQARVSARITEGGKVMLDVDRCVGNRCAEIVEDVAAAVGGAVETRHFKDAYYKPGRQRVKARTRT